MKSEEFFRGQNKLYILKEYHDIYGFQSFYHDLFNLEEHQIPVCVQLMSP